MNFDKIYTGERFLGTGKLFLNQEMGEGACVQGKLTGPTGCFHLPIQTTVVCATIILSGKWLFAEEKRVEESFVLFREISQYWKMGAGHAPRENKLSCQSRIAVAIFLNNLLKKITFYI